MGNPLLCHNVTGDDVLRWAENLEALGSILSIVGYKGDKDEILNAYGEQIGQIVRDYASAIHSVLKKAYPVLDPFLEHLTKKASVQPGIGAEADGDPGGSLTE